MMSAFGAGTASADFHASSENAALTGSDKQIRFNFQGSSWECGGTLSGVMPAPQQSPWIELNPNFQCYPAFGWIPITVDTTGCKFRFQAWLQSINVKSCTNGGLIVTWEAKNLLKCEILVPNQQPGSGSVSYTNDPQEKYVDIRLKSSLNASTITSTGLCPFSVGEGSMSIENAEYRVHANAGTSKFWWQFIE